MTGTELYDALADLCVRHGQPTDRTFDLLREAVASMTAADCLHVNTDTQPDGSVLCNLCGAVLPAGDEGARNLEAMVDELDESAWGQDHVN